LHSNRTINAWENGTRRIFCDECHKVWRQSRPSNSTGHSVPRGNSANVNRHGNAAYRSIQGAGRSGCLGVFVVLVFLPPTLVYFAFQYV
jgi:hypothetical protein